MTTDITELARKVKTEASAIDDTQWYLAKPSEIRLLVEALEKAQARIAELSVGKVGNALLERENHHVEVVGKLTDRIAELESSVIAPGIMRCAKCSFVLTKNSINMSAGTITAGDSKSEPCPNGCGPLWPVTWREKALQARDDSEQWFDDLQIAKKRIAELESRTVKLAADRAAESGISGYDGIEFYRAGWNARGKADKEALTAAGINWEAE